MAGSTCVTCSTSQVCVSLTMDGKLRVGEIGRFLFLTAYLTAYLVALPAIRRAWIEAFFVRMLSTTDLASETLPASS